MRVPRALSNWMTSPTPPGRFAVFITSVQTIWTSGARKYYLMRICARQEPEGHFGPRHGKGFDEQLRRAFECLWAIAEVNSDFRLFQTLSDYPTSAPTK